jgi:hypothetical protein
VVPLAIKVAVALSFASVVEVTVLASPVNVTLCWIADLFPYLFGAPPASRPMGSWTLCRRGSPSKSCLEHTTRGLAAPCSKQSDGRKWGQFAEFSQRTFKGASKTNSARRRSNAT